MRRTRNYAFAKFAGVSVLCPGPGANWPAIAVGTAASTREEVDLMSEGRQTPERKRARLAGGFLAGAIVLSGLAIGSPAPAGATGGCAADGNGVSYTWGSGASCTGKLSAAIAIGPGAIATATGSLSRAVAIGPGSIATADGVNNRATATGIEVQATAAAGNNNTAIGTGIRNVVTAGEGGINFASATGIDQTVKATGASNSATAVGIRQTVTAGGAESSDNQAFAYGRTRW